ncbi:MAG: hypothetical protein K0Q81_557, partial [Paenibacillus sp.]|nr:hypothetical protein [Paenibacillus sp.]
MKLGVIGYGNRISHVINELQTEHPSAKITAVVDVRQEELKQKHEQFRDGHVTFFDSPEAMIEGGN